MAGEEDEELVEGVMQQVEGLLDTSVAAYGYVIRDASSKIDLSGVDFEKLKAIFDKTSRKRTEAEKLRAALHGEVQRLARLNKTRLNYAQRLEAMIQDYNSGASNTEQFFNDLMQLGRDLSEEMKRALREKLTEEELAVFDLIAGIEEPATEQDREAVKALLISCTLHIGVNSRTGRVIAYFSGRG